MRIDDVAIWLTREQRISVAHAICHDLPNPRYLSKCEATQCGLPTAEAADTIAEAARRYEADYVAMALRLFSPAFKPKPGTAT